ncbi:MAG TPA: TetR/AcrR family transcriptional regulator [Candidatus Dormibacteraeota bacterium]|jgi:AcrR family transcriptional regulator|nr:TetR/AcrR family transcriptional regulator [Candidatus Dormibacteraeota bacterium]
MTNAQRATRRVDAEQNRTRILEVARNALASSSDVALHSIAKRAGVGQGTLYRHFPTREALVLAVYRQDVGELIDAASALLAEHEPGEAMRLWFDRLAAFGRVKHGLAGVLREATRASLSDEHYRPVVEAIEQLLSAGQDSGLLRPDVDAEEVLLLVSFLWRGDQDDGWDGGARHMLRIVLDGLRAPD